MSLGVSAVDRTIEKAIEEENEAENKLSPKSPTEADKKTDSGKNEAVDGEKGEIEKGESKEVAPEKDENAKGKGGEKKASLAAVSPTALRASVSEFMAYAHESVNIVSRTYFEVIKYTIYDKFCFVCTSSCRSPAFCRTPAQGRGVQPLELNSFFSKTPKNKINV